MKTLARSYIWWAGLDQDLEQLVKHCHVCQVNCSLPPTAPLHPWECPNRPWTRVHLDFAGPLASHMLLVMVDAHPK